MTLFQASVSSASARVDASAGIIREVAVITQGPALGHGMMIDRKTLAQVKASAETYPQGLKVKLNHGSGVDAIVGFLTGFRLTPDGSKLAADFHLLDTSPHRAYVLEIANRMPGSFGMSIAFSGVAEKVDGVAFARCSEIYSCDLVADPAANPDGLFGRRFDEWQKGKGQSEPTDPARNRNNQSAIMDSEILTQIGKMIDDKLAAVSASFDAKLGELKTSQTAALGKIEDVARLSNEAADRAALAAVKEFAKTLGTPANNAAAPSAPAAPAPTAQKFEEIVRGHAKYATSRKTAISETISQHPAEYAAYNARVRSGEVIMF
jgi:hypothetical protein